MNRLLIAIGVLIGLYAAHAVAFPSYNYAFRLIIDVDTPTGLKTGSSVISLTWRSQVPIGPRSAVTQVKGEAVFVDLGGGQHVIATLGFGPKGADDKLEYLASEAFKRAGHPIDIQALAKVRGSAPLTGHLIPAFVTFTDLGNPKTGRIVLPDDFPAVFGAGIRLRGARIEMTDEPFTRGIEKKLTWLPHPKYLSGQFACGQGEPNCLHGGHFTR